MPKSASTGTRAVAGRAGSRGAQEKGAERDSVDSSSVESSSADEWGPSPEGRSPKGTGQQTAARASRKGRLRKGTRQQTVAHKSPKGRSPKGTGQQTTARASRAAVQKKHVRESSWKQSDPKMGKGTLQGNVESEEEAPQRKRRLWKAGDMLKKPNPAPEAVKGSAGSRGAPEKGAERGTVQLISDDDMGWTPSRMGRSSKGTGRQATPRASRAAEEALHVRKPSGPKKAEGTLQGSATSGDEAPPLKRRLQKAGSVSRDAGGTPVDTPESVDIVEGYKEPGPGEEEPAGGTGEAGTAATFHVRGPFPLVVAGIQSALLHACSKVSKAAQKRAVSGVGDGFPRGLEEISGRMIDILMLDSP